MAGQKDTSTVDRQMAEALVEIIEQQVKAKVAVLKSESDRRIAELEKRIDALTACVAALSTRPQIVEIQPSPVIVKSELTLPPRPDREIKTIIVRDPKGRIQSMEGRLTTEK